MRASETKFARASLSAVEADGTFTGYASLFGKADLGRDMVMQGAFRASLARRGVAGVKMLYQHDPAEPIGEWSGWTISAIFLSESGERITRTIVGRKGR